MSHTAPCVTHNTESILRYPTSKPKATSHRSAAECAEASHETFFKVTRDGRTTYRTKRTHPDRGDTKSHTKATQQSRQ
jgi:hypothetical protein